MITLTCFVCLQSCKIDTFFYLVMDFFINHCLMSLIQINGLNRGLPILSIYACFGLLKHKLTSYEMYITIIHQYKTCYF